MAEFEQQTRLRSLLCPCVSLASSVLHACGMASFGRPGVAMQALYNVMLGWGM